MARKRFTLDFKEMEEYIQKLESMGGDLKETFDKSLRATHALVTKRAHESIRPHKRSGRTEASILDEARVEWNGHIGSVDVGYDIKNGGLPSVFLMYGTPRMKKDPKMYNAIYGTATRKKVSEIQKTIFTKAINERM